MNEVMSVVRGAARLFVSVIQKHPALTPQLRRFGHTKRIKSSFLQSGKMVNKTAFSAAMPENTRLLSGSAADSASRVKRVSIEGNIGEASLYFPCSVCDELSVNLCSVLLHDSCWEVDLCEAPAICLFRLGSCDRTCQQVAERREHDLKGGQFFVRTHRTIQEFETTRFASSKPDFLVIFKSGLDQ